MRKDVTIDVKVDGGNNGALFSLGQPVSADHNADARVGGDGSDISSLKPEDHLKNGDHYQVTGSVNVASIDQLKAAGTDYPQWVTDRYLDLPATLPRRVGVKARDVARGQETPYDKASAIEKYLRTFPTDYSVPATPAGRDSVDYFLFDLQRGYFDYHASAMAVMLRELGIPARVATGYALDPLRREGESDTFDLTERQAFAWPEVYFPSIGWVEFSPTPAQPLIKRPGSAPAAPIQPDAGSPNERGLSDEVDLGALAGVPAPSADETGDGGGGSSAWPMLIALGIAGAVLLTLAGGAKVAWEYGLGGMPRPAQLWEKTVRLATLGKAGPRPSETPREYAERLERDVPGTDAAGYLAASYERSRFGQKAVSEDEAERLERAWSSVRGGLLRRALRLKPRSPE